MTEYWVSQGNKWCEYCKIFIANNPVTIRTHEFGQRHKENVAKKLATIRKETVAKEKEKQQAVKDLERIEAKARQSYEKDLVASQKKEVCVSAATRQGLHDNFEVGENRLLLSRAVNRSEDSLTATSDHKADGKWATKEEAFQAHQVVKDAVHNISTVRATASKQVIANVVPENLKDSTNPASRSLSNASNAALPGPVLQVPKGTVRLGKGVPSSLDLGKRKREEKTDLISSKEAAALAAREAARKRTQEREKGFLGLYQSY
eukprot:c26381_g1_i2 orf=252-1037(-)